MRLEDVRSRIRQKPGLFIAAAAGVIALLGAAAGILIYGRSAEKGRVNEFAVHENPVRIDLVPRLYEYRASGGEAAYVPEDDTAEVLPISEPDTEGSGTEAAKDPDTEPEKLDFVDAHGEWHVMTVDPRVERHDYDWSHLKRDGKKVSYEGDDRYTVRRGVDVSSHLGGIDWNKVKEDGCDFVFVRMVYRGYGESGSLNLDKRWKENVTGAQAAGLDVGVYVFSQAVNEEEALEEAELVIKNLEGINLQLPVVFDPELIIGRKARTNDVTGEQFTKNTIVFCDRVKEAGFEPMIYANMRWEAFLFDLYVLSDLPIWYADYENVPQTPYKFSIWQYTDKGRVAGINANSDINLWFVKNDEEKTKTTTDDASLHETDVLLDEPEIVGEP